jgi:hypothetical protein
MKNTNRASDPQKIIPRSDELYNGPFSCMMVFCFSLNEIEFWWSKNVLIGGGKRLLGNILKSRFLSVIF